ncbi:MAG: kdgK [Haloplasmataceae bacterium]|jgi:2-dehydro-3-deoxygluconokinase|nr:kdgK [Haloplasmataceae bacterium]
MEVNKVVTFGEIMLRLSPPMYNKIEQTNEYQAYYGGGEANVAISLVNLGHDVQFVTKLPNNQLGDGAIKHLRAQGVDISHVIRGGDNIGIYFLEHGFGGRPSKVLYNRKHSAFSEMNSEELDFDLIFNNVKWFHVSGITLALSESIRQSTLLALKKAKEHHVLVSFDFNYRAKLWSLKEAKEAFLKVLPYVDVCFATIRDLKDILEYKFDGPDEEYTRELHMMQFAKEFQIDYMFGTDREVISANENILSAFAILRDKTFQTKEYRFNIIDRVGGGDAFASGVISGLLNNYSDFKCAVELGLACSVLKHTLYGDASILKMNEILEFMKSSGRSLIER